MEKQLEKEIAIEVKDIASASGIAEKIMQTMKNSMGFVPNMYGVMANNPALLDAYTYGYKTFRENAGFTAIEQEIIFLSISIANSCEYCVAAHSFVADKMSGVPIEITNSIRDGKEISDNKLNALCNFTKAITTSRGIVTNSELNNFLNAGYNTEHILGIIAAIGVKTMSNYSNHIAKTKVDDVFAPRVWNKN